MREEDEASIRKLALEALKERLDILLEVVSPEHQKGEDPDRGNSRLDHLLEDLLEAGFRKLEKGGFHGRMGKALPGNPIGEALSFQHRPGIRGTVEKKDRC